MFCGSRKEFKENYAQAIIEDMMRYLHGSIIIHGGAVGIDAIIDKCAKAEGGIEVEVYRPDYIDYGRNAPIKRNIEMLERADKAIALWNGKSSGTRFVIDYCKKNNISYEVVKI